MFGCKNILLLIKQGHIMEVIFMSKLPDICVYLIVTLIKFYIILATYGLKCWGFCIPFTCIHSVRFKQTNNEPGNIRSHDYLLKK